MNLTEECFRDLKQESRLLNLINKKASIRKFYFSDNIAIVLTIDLEKILLCLKNDMVSYGINVLNG